MKQSERDELLVRLDERTINIYKLTEKQEAHLNKLNSHVSDNKAGIAKNKRILYCLIGFLSGSGVLTGGWFGISQLIA